MAYLKVKKSNLNIDDEGVIQGAQETAKKFPKLECSLIMVDKPAIKSNLVLYGSAIPGLLEIEHIETEKELHFAASFDSKSGKWASNSDAIETFMTAPSQSKKELKELQKSELEAILTAAKITIPAGAKKPDLVALIEEEDLY
jgi:hypothetical protein